jgi:sialic acid synthase SpsE
MLRSTITAGGIDIGGGQPCVFLPDIGTFFNQDLERGAALVDAVAAAGCVFVKGEVLHDAAICLESPLLENITTRDAVVTRESYRSVIARKVLPLAAYERLFRHAAERGLRLALSVYDFAGLEFALEQQAAILKIASSNVVHRPLIERVAAAGVPALMDTGGATMDEVQRAVRWFTGAGGTQLIVEHSPPAPPAPVARHHLRRLESYRQDFACPVGLSDHHAGVEMLFAAIALGASVVEKGVYPDEVERDQDVAHGLPASRLADTVRQCANVSAALQPPPAGAPAPAGHPARMGLVAARALAAGHRLREGDVTFAFPAVGIPVQEVNDAIGLQLVRPVAAGTPIEWPMLQGRPPGARLK